MLEAFRVMRAIHEGLTLLATAAAQLQLTIDQRTTLRDFELRLEAAGESLSSLAAFGVGPVQQHDLSAFLRSLRDAAGRSPWEFVSPSAAARGPAATPS